MENPLSAPEDLNIDLARGDEGGPAATLELWGPEEIPWDPERARATGARWVAGVLLSSFAVTILIVLVAAIVILASGANEADTKRLTDTFVAILDALSNFLTAVFAPLLAFVLGYYFGEKRSETP